MHVSGESLKTLLNPQTSLSYSLETIIREKGGRKYEQQCTQLLAIVARLRPKLASALAEYTWENPPRELFFLNDMDITAISTVLYSKEQWLFLGNLYLLL